MTSRPNNRTDQKRLGAWYTPLSLVRPLVEWAVRSAEDQVLDPAVGDGCFLHEAAHRLQALRRTSRLGSLHGVDVNPSAARVTESALDSSAWPKSARRILTRDFFELSAPPDPNSPLPQMDVVIGNPPYVRYQSFNGRTRERALDRARRAGVRLTELSSSWAAFVVHSSTFLKPGGRLALVLPVELLHAAYSEPVRRFLRRSFHSAFVLGFERHVFPQSQERIVLLLAEGWGRSPAGELRLARVSTPDHITTLQRLIVEAERHAAGAEPSKWECGFNDEASRVLDDLTGRGLLVPLSRIGKAGIGFVSGANDYFVMTRREADQRGFPHQILRHALITARQVPGALLTCKDMRDLVDRDERCLLWGGDGLSIEEVRRYARLGERQGIARRYKCRQRNPWYVVPGAGSPDAFLTYMSGAIPRIVLNKAGATCSNNLLALRLHGIPRASRTAFACAFYNSATLLSAERVGRHYGGGVLKLEPSEADRLLVPSPDLLAKTHGLAGLIRDVDLALRNRQPQRAAALVDEILWTKSGRLNAAALSAMRRSVARRQRDRIGAARPQSHAAPPMAVIAS